MNAKSPGIDVFASSMHVEKILFSAAGWYEPLNKYLDNAEPHAAGLQLEGLRPGGDVLGAQGRRDHRRDPDGRRARRLHVPEGPLRREGA